MKPAHLPDHAGDLRRRLVDVRAICERLGLAEGAQHQTGGLKIKCPWHPERTPSCSIRVASDGTIAVNCFGCGATGDVFHLVAVVNGLDVRRDFERVLALAREIDGSPIDAAVPPPARPLTPPALVPNYPPADEVSAFWNSLVGVYGTPSGDWLSKERGIDPAAVEDQDLGRHLPDNVPVPAWALTWARTNHRCVLAVYDAMGAMRSVRARRIVKIEGDRLKTIVPKGYTTAGLVMADGLGRQLLETGRMPDFWPAGVPLEVLIAEGDPRFLVAATRESDANLAAPAAFGITSGAWTPAIAGRIPDGADVYVATDHDPAGDRYHDAIVRTFRGRPGRRLRVRLGP